MVIGRQIKEDVEYICELAFDAYKEFKVDSPADKDEIRSIISCYLLNIGGYEPNSNIAISSVYYVMQKNHEQNLGLAHYEKKFNVSAQDLRNCLKKIEENCND